MKCCLKLIRLGKKGPKEDLLVSPKHSGKTSTFLMMGELTDV